MAQDRRRGQQPVGPADMIFLRGKVRVPEAIPDQIGVLVDLDHPVPAEEGPPIISALSERQVEANPQERDDASRGENLSHKQDLRRGKTLTAPMGARQVTKDAQHPEADDPGVVVIVLLVSNQRQGEDSQTGAERVAGSPFRHA